MKGDIFQVKPATTGPFLWLEKKDIVYAGGEAELLRLAKSEHHPPPYLVADVATGFDPRTTNLSKMPLLADLVALQGRRDDILGFANRYGALLPLVNYSLEVKEASRGPGVPERLDFASGGSIWFWQRTIWWIKVLNQISEWLRDKQDGPLGQHIVWKPEDYGTKRKGFYLTVKAGGRTIPKGYLGPQPQQGIVPYWNVELPQWNQRLRQHGPTTVIPKREQFFRSTVEPGDYRSAARELLLQAINSGLHEEIAVLEEGRGDKEALRPVFTLDEEGFNLDFGPSSLLTAIWIQFAQVLCGNRKFITCSICEDPLDLTGYKRPGAAQTHTKCSEDQKAKKNNLKERMLLEFIKHPETADWYKEFERWNRKHKDLRFRSAETMQRTYWRAFGKGGR